MSDEEKLNEWLLDEHTHYAAYGERKSDRKSWTLRLSVGLNIRLLTYISAYQKDCKYAMECWAAGFINDARGPYILKAQTEAGAKAEAFNVVAEHVAKMHKLLTEFGK